jgi:hypothetical protein
VILKLDLKEMTPRQVRSQVGELIRLAVSSSGVDEDTAAFDVSIRADSKKKTEITIAITQTK